MNDTCNFEEGFTLWKHQISSFSPTPTTIHRHGTRKQKDKAGWTKEEEEEENGVGPLFSRNEMIKWNLERLGFRGRRLGLVWWFQEWCWMREHWNPLVSACLFQRHYLATMSMRKKEEIGKYFYFGCLPTTEIYSK